LLALIPYGVDTTIDHDLTRRHIQLEHTCITGPITTIFTGAGAIINKSPMPTNPDGSDSTGTLIIDGGPVPSPPNSKGTRGTFLQAIVAAAFAAPNSLPPDMPAGTSTPAQGVNQSINRVV